MLFDNVEFQQGAAYWLASRGVNANSDIAGFGPGVVGDGDGSVRAGTGYMFNSRGFEYEHCAGVRPVVSLKSAITEKEVPRIGDKTEERWNFSRETGDQVQH